MSVPISVCVVASTLVEHDVHERAGDKRLVDRPAAPMHGPEHLDSDGVSDERSDRNRSYGHHCKSRAVSWSYQPPDDEAYGNLMEDDRQGEGDLHTFVTGDERGALQQSVEEETREAHEQRHRIGMSM